MSPQRIGEWVLVAAAVIALALVLILTSFATGPGASGPAAAMAADCVPVQHTKTVTKKVRVKKNGKVRKVKRKRKVHWTTCEPPPPPPPTLGCVEPASTVGVIARDNMESPRYTLTRPCVTAGEVDVELNNQGEDPHHVFLRPAGLASADAVFRIPDDPPDYELPPGQVREATLNLTAGDWYLWCDLLTHEQQGMFATLQVR